MRYVPGRSIPGSKRQETRPRCTTERSANVAAPGSSWKPKLEELVASRLLEITIENLDRWLRVEHGLQPAAPGRPGFPWRRPFFDSGVDPVLDHERLIDDRKPSARLGS